MHKETTHEVKNNGNNQLVLGKRDKIYPKLVITILLFQIIMLLRQGFLNYYKNSHRRS